MAGSSSARMAFRTSRAALAPGSPETLPPGWAPAPHRPEPGHRRAVLLIAAGGAQQEHLVQRDLAMMPLAAGEAELGFQIVGRQHFRRQ